MAYRQGKDTDDAFIGAMLEADGIAATRSLYNAFVKVHSK